MKGIVISTAIGLFIIGGAFWLTKNKAPMAPVATASNVSVVDGVQIIEINAKGGYSPGKSVAKAGMPTVIRFQTSTTFDCSSSVRIPSLNITKALPQTGTTDIDVGSQNAITLQGTCGMGMYPFEVDFQS